MRIADSINKDIEDRLNKKISNQLAVEEHARKYADKAVNWLCNRAIKALKKEARDGYNMAFFNIQKPIFSRYHACETTLILANKRLFAEGIRLKYDTFDFKYVTRMYDKSSILYAPIDSASITAYIFDDFKCNNCDKSISDPSDIRAIFFGKYLCVDCVKGSTLIGDKEITFKVKVDNPICFECKQPNLEIGTYKVCYCDGIGPFTYALSMSNYANNIDIPSDTMLSKYIDLENEFNHKMSNK